MYSHLAVLNPLYGGVGPYGGGVGFRRSYCRFSVGIFNENMTIFENIVFDVFTKILKH
jgi:hypothetical protein